MQNEHPTFLQRNAITIKMVIVTVIILLLLIPKGMITSLISERQYRQNEVFREISQTWSADQKIIGPVLSIPYLASYYDKENKKHVYKKYYKVAPQELRIDNQLLPEERHIGIFKFLVYHSKNDLNGHFEKPEINVPQGYNLEEILWNDAHVAFEISDIRGIEDEVACKINGVRHEMKPSTHNEFGLNAIIARPFSENNLKDLKTITFNIKLNVKGSQSIQFSPIAKNTQLHSQGQWGDPRFIGSFSPESPEIEDKGFSAQWNILEYNRNIPEAWNSLPSQFEPYYFGVELIQMNDHYQKSERSAKYALLIIALTFLAFFLSEVMMRLKVHPIQYVLIGLALCIFYILLLSLAEHWGFNAAYALSGLATVLLISTYSKSIFSSWKPALLSGLGLAFFYAFVFVVIQLEDYALLAGSLGLFIILAGAMYLTRNIKWYQLKTT